MALPAVIEVIEAMNEVVARDGGSLKLVRYDDKGRVLSVEFAAGVNEDCDACSISSEMLGEFLVAGLEARDIKVAKVDVSTVERQS